jgi:hypothetical protein
MQELYTRKALEVLADYCDMVGYDDSWLLQVAAEAVDNGKWELARDAVVLFCSGRELITVVKRATDQIIRLSSSKLTGSKLLPTRLKTSWKRSSRSSLK